MKRKLCKLVQPDVYEVVNLDDFPAHPDWKVVPWLWLYYSDGTRRAARDLPSEYFINEPLSLL